MPSTPPTTPPPTRPGPFAADLSATARGAVWRLRLLGNFELSDGTHRHNKLGTRAAMALLARLCLQPGVAQPREALVELLWPGVALEPGRQRLRQTLLTLKQVLEPPGLQGGRVLDIDRLAIRLVPGAVDCDAAAFEQACKRRAAEPARELYAGELMPGFFDEWISDERLRLEGLFDRLPLPTLMQTPVALAQESAPAAAAPRQAGPQRSSLPSYLTRLIGVDTQATRLRQEVCGHRLVTLRGAGGAGKTRLSVEVARSLLLAPSWSAPGAAPVVGDMTESEAGASFEMVVFVPLAACRSREQLLDQLLLSLHLASGSGTPLDRLVQALDGRHVLLVLDNFEQLVDEGAEVVADLGQRLPLLHQLVTSRRALGVAGEQDIVSMAMTLPAAEAPVGEAALNPAVALFVDRARAARAEFHLHEGNCRSVIDLVGLLEGMPLAIELAAARIRSMKPTEMTDTLRRARGRSHDRHNGKAHDNGIDTAHDLGHDPNHGPSAEIDPDAADDPASALDLLARPVQRGRRDTRHQSINECIDWSWQLLDPPLRRLLAALTVFPGGFTAAAARAVCMDSPKEKTSLAMHLDELLSHSLLRATSDDELDTRRFDFYEPIREFAQRTLPGERCAVLRRQHRAWARAWSRGLPATPPLDTLRAELPNLVAAMASAVADGEPRAAIDIALALRSALDELELPGSGIRALASAVDTCEEVVACSDGASVLALVQFRAGNAADARRTVQRALATTPADQPAIRARALLMDTAIAWQGGERGPLLLAQLHEAQTLAEACHDLPTLARIDSLHADIVCQRDANFALATQLFSRASKRWLDIGDLLSVLRMQYCLACVSFSSHRQHDACAQIDPVIAEARSLHAWGRLSQSLNVRGSARKKLRQWGAAKADLGESLRVAWNALSPWNVAYVFWNLPHALACSGQAQVAQQLSGFIEHHWSEHFGPLNPAFQKEIRRVRRVAGLRIDRATSQAAFDAGARLSPAAAVALALAAVQG